MPENNIMATSMRGDIADNDIIASTGRRKNVRAENAHSPAAAPKPRRVNGGSDIIKSEIQKKNLETINEKYTRVPSTARPATPASRPAVKRESASSRPAARGTARSYSENRAQNKRPVAKAAAQRTSSIHNAARPSAFAKSRKKSLASSKKHGGSSKGRVRRDTPLKAKKISHSVLTVKGTKHSPFPVGIIFAIATVAAVFMFIINLYVQIDACNDKLGSLSTSITDGKEVVRELEFSLENKYSSIDIEQVAETYGLVPESQLQRRYVSVMDSEDQTDVIVKEEDESVPSIVLSGVISSIGDIFSYFS